MRSLGDRPGERSWIPAVSIGAWAAAVAVVPELALRSAILFAPAVTGIAWWAVSKSNGWVIGFFAAAILTPPLAAGLGGIALHLAPVFAGLGVIAGIVRISAWRVQVNAPRAAGGVLPASLLFFLAILIESVGFAGLYSGWSVAAGSLIRVLLFSITVFVFFYAYAGPVEFDAFSMTRILFAMSVAAALFACFDFYYQLPAPAGSGPQYVWLEEGVFRRAQGLFYEASTLGNFCVFFLVMSVIAFFRPSGARPCTRASLAAGAMVLSAALLFSYSRSSLLNLFVALCTFAWIERGRARRTIVAFCTCFLLAAVLVHWVFPSFAGSYWNRILASFEFIASSPNGVLSGRVDTWEKIGSFLLNHPWHALFGIGYKTLPYSNVLGENLIADNTYLSLLVETGIVGLGALIALHAGILRTAARAARSAEPRTSFLGAWVLCFWTGEMVQMLSADLITFWRVLPIYFFVLGMAARGLRARS